MGTVSRKLNLGSGPHAVSGWINIDRSPNTVLSRLPWLKSVLKWLQILNDGHLQRWDSSVVRGDIRALPYGNSSVTAIYSSHALEHLHFKDAERTIEESYRVLEAGGILRIALPNSLVIAEMLLEAERRRDGGMARKANELLLAHPTEQPGGVRRLVGLVGGHVHYWQPTPALVVQMMLDAGFSEIQHCEFHEGRLPDLLAIETRRQSFFLEGVKGSTETHGVSAEL